MGTAATVEKFGETNLEVITISTGRTLLPLDFDPPHYAVDRGGVYRIKDGQWILVSKNIERWAPYCIKHVD